MDRDHEQGLADGKACLEWALYYLGLGWSVIPLCPPDHVGVGREHGKTCKSPGKAPLIPWKEFQGRLPTEAEVRGWWRQWSNANVGVVMGAVSRMVGIDIDGQGGEQVIAELYAGNSYETCEFMTPGGGRRFLFKITDGERYQPYSLDAGNSQEVRLLGEGSQTVAPPSRHPSGGLYEWVNAPQCTPK